MNSNAVKALALNHVGSVVNAKGKFIQGNSVIVCNTEALHEVCKLLGVEVLVDDTSCYKRLVAEMTASIERCHRFLEHYYPEALE